MNETWAQTSKVSNFHSFNVTVTDLPFWFSIQDDASIEGNLTKPQRSKKWINKSFYWVFAKKTTSLHSGAVVRKQIGAYANIYINTMSQNNEIRKLCFVVIRLIRLTDGISSAHINEGISSSWHI